MDRSIYDEIRQAGDAAKSEIELRSLVKEFSRELLNASADLERANSLIMDINENPVNFDAQHRLTTFTSEGVMSCDPKRLEYGMDAYMYGSGKAPDLDEEESLDADYYFQHVVVPILNRYDVSELDLNKISKEKNQAFTRNFVSDTKDNE